MFNSITQFISEISPTGISPTITQSKNSITFTIPTQSITTIITIQNSQITNISTTTTFTSIPDFLSDQHITTEITEMFINEFGF